MKKTTILLPLFKQFIRDSETGKRLKKNGEKITKNTIDNYRYVHNNLTKFCVETDFDFRICNVYKLNTREFISEKNYWKKFYKKYTEFLYKKGCHDNYVGANIKIIRAFFNYLKDDKNIPTGDFQKLFYIRKEEVEILVLSPEQLKFLIHDKDFDQSLTPAIKRTKDMFVFGCTTGLRISDINRLTNKNFEKQNDDWYLKIKSQKTKTYSFIKLPNYAATIYKRYKPKSSKTPIFKNISLFIFNRNLKLIGEKAGYIQPIHMTRERLGKAKNVTINGKQKQIRFCDKMSSHMMRRTAITTLLILGMPEHLVRKISGHSHASSSFNRYVHYAQAYIDKEIDKIHSKLDSY
ncbi:tyrosine-type recombinase/integrase [Flavivirga spongiicola]|uniref:Site-specific integrase n=1 Tax=Flavivirga spongiicola TaxID=421621 RepID=A0ABU7XPF0_9FLAO|nr:tyrosine-type recombinase/integrase [Flavivirga sp. MEBiC05379]MDO5981453.1 tyrosine-type recombinase/integrase [Flavivirga sp. MEBiC05379]MDO5981905.1 tyrosine-type recombinase/integrase [Flavivirga sp. MEBiC05379]